MRWIGNALALGMLPERCVVVIAPVTAAEVPADARSCVGHASTATVLAKLLGRPVPAERVAVSLSEGDELYVAALSAADGSPLRLAEGQVLGETDLARVRLSFRRIRIV